MFLFVIYAVAVWYFAIKYRREWLAFVAVLLGLGGCLLVIYLHTRLNDWMGGTINLPVLRGIMYPYTALVVGVGLYAACLPRRGRHGHCDACGYSLAGLPHDEVERCPECGAELGRSPRARPRRTTPARTLATARATTRARRAAARARAARPRETIAAR